MKCVDGGMFQAIANKIAEVFFLNRKKNKKEEIKEEIIVQMQMNSNERFVF